MPIETICQTCARKLRVADEFAGKKARCPQCGTIYVVPGDVISGNVISGNVVPGSVVPGNVVPGNVVPGSVVPGYAVPNRPDTRAGGVDESLDRPRPDDEKWQVRTPDNHVYGPVPKSELDQWVAEGRIPVEASLQSESAAYWRPAAEVFPQLRHSTPLQAAMNPFAEQPLESPFAVPTRPPSRPHRGVLVLIFAILGWVACPIFAPVAWIMGQSDLRDMRRGLMDDSGMSLTQAGMVLGMIETIFALLFMALMCLGGLA
ncbi:MAG: DUF4190 domain-containing protein [Pirellulaceae bacterium]